MLNVEKCKEAMEVPAAAMGPGGMLGGLMGSQSPGSGGFTPSMPWEGGGKSSKMSLLRPTKLTALKWNKIDIFVL